MASSGRLAKNRPRRTLLYACGDFRLRHPRSHPFLRTRGRIFLYFDIGWLRVFLMCHGGPCLRTRRRKNSPRSDGKVPRDDGCSEWVAAYPELKTKGEGPSRARHPEPPPPRGERGGPEKESVHFYGFLHLRFYLDRRRTFCSERVARGAPLCVSMWRSCGKTKGFIEGA